MYSSVSYGTNEPNLNRVIEETVACVTELDNRIHALKIGICQALPQLTPALFQKELGFGGYFGARTGLPFNTGFIPNFGSHVGLPQGIPAVGAWGLHGVPYGLNAPVNTSAYPGGWNYGTYAPFGVSQPWTGVASAPWAGVTAPSFGGSFRTF